MNRFTVKIAAGIVAALIMCTEAVPSSLTMNPKKVSADAISSFYDSSAPIIELPAINDGYAESPFLSPEDEYYSSDIEISSEDTSALFNTYNASAIRLVFPVNGYTLSTVKINQGLHDYDSSIDFGAYEGCKILSACDGKIHTVTRCNRKHYGDYHLKSLNPDGCDGAGNGIIVLGTDGRYYHYAHMLAGSIPAGLKEGSSVKAGQVLGKMGTTGYSSGIHLHFSIRKGVYSKSGNSNPLKETYIAAPSTASSSSSLPAVTTEAYIPSNSKPVYYPACSSEINSLVDGLISVGGNHSFEARTELASLNGIKGYSGTAEQNTKLLSLLKSGKLIKNYSSEIKPVSTTTVTSPTVNPVTTTTVTTPTVNSVTTAAVTTTAENYNHAEAAIVHGDINADGKADITDLSELSLALVGDKKLSDSQKTAADVDRNSEVNLADLAKFRQFISKVIDSLD